MDIDSFLSKKIGEYESEYNLSIDQTILNLLNKDFTVLANEQIIAILELVNLVLVYEYKTVVTISTNQKTVIIGDLHGNIDDLKQILKENKETKLTNLKTNYIILGDFIDRGGYSFETSLAILLLKVTNRKKVVVLRGNHENMFLMSASLSHMIAKSKNLIGEYFYRFLIENYDVKTSENEIQKYLKDFNVSYSNENIYDLAKREIQIQKISQFFGIKRLIMRPDEFEMIKSDTPLSHKQLGFEFYRYKINEVINAYKDVFKFLPYCCIFNYMLSNNTTRSFFMTHGGIGFGKQKEVKLKFGNVQTVRYLWNPVDVNVRNFDNPKSKHWTNSRKVNEWTTFKFAKFKKLPFIPSRVRKVTSKALDEFLFEYNLQRIELNKKRERELTDKEYWNINRGYTLLNMLLWSDLTKKDGIMKSPNRSIKSKDYYIELLVGKIIRTRTPYTAWGPDITKRFLNLNNFDYIIRGHQPTTTLYTINKKTILLGFRFHESHDDKVITVHSNSYFYPLTKMVMVLGGRTKKIFLAERSGSYLTFEDDIMNTVSFNRKKTQVLVKVDLKTKIKKSKVNKLKFIPAQIKFQPSLDADELIEELDQLIPHFKGEDYVFFLCNCQYRIIKGEPTKEVLMDIMKGLKDPEQCHETALKYKKFLEEIKI